MSTLVLPRICGPEKKAAANLNQTDMYDHAVLRLWQGLPMHHSLDTLDAEMLPMSATMIHFLSKHTSTTTTLASTSTSITSTANGISFLGVRSLSLCLTEPIELQQVCSLLSTLTPALQQLKAIPLTYDHRWFNTKEV